MDSPQNKIIFSGIQPSGVLHLGNYLGAIKQWAALQYDNTAYLCIVDQHAITVSYDKAQLKDRILDLVAMYIACGIDPHRSTIFVQSHVPAHTELAWLLSTITPFGELSRMTQFKDKSESHAATLGLFSYPVLMAADILLYNTDFVPVGEDQTQHLELSRLLARRFNTTFGNMFTLPSVLISEAGARIMSLTDPSRKMSKSDHPKSYIALTDDADTIAQKIQSATTDTQATFSFENSGPAVKNLLHMYQALTGNTSAAIEHELKGSGYQVFKDKLKQVLIKQLSPIRDKFHTLRQDEETLVSILTAGREKANTVASQTLQKAKEHMGFLTL